MKAGDQVICTRDYVTAVGIKYFSVGDIVELDKIINNSAYIKLKNQYMDYLKLNMINQGLVLGKYEYFKLKNDKYESRRSSNMHK